MYNKLFVVCPFSNMEIFLKNNYGPDAYFLTFTGANIQHQELECMSEVRHLIISENIQAIYIVNDTSCRFIHGMLTGNWSFNMPSLSVFEDLYIEHYSTLFKNQSLIHQQRKMAELNVKYQVSELLDSFILGGCIRDLHIDIRGLITTKSKNLIKEIQFDNCNREVYEL